MVELRPAGAFEKGDSDYASRFAGDVTNFAVYLKRLTTSSCVQFFSATGTDVLSDKLYTFLSNEDIDSTLVARSDKQTVGLYMIHTDKTGERTFTYWRSDSAARKMLQLADQAMLSRAIDAADYFYFSGITVAILDSRSRQQLFGIAEKFRDQGKTVIFDPNYRERLWSGQNGVLKEYERAYRLCNILLSGIEDEQSLWGVSSTTSALEHLVTYGIDQIILTNGPNAISGYDDGRLFEVEPVAPDSVVDTTSAGDAFNAGFIAARHVGFSAEESVLKASKLASVVIGLPGAIIAKTEMPTP